MMSTKKLLLSAAISALMAAPMIAKADAFLFNPAGTGATGALSVTLIDQAPGNALAKGAASIVAPAIPGTPANGATPAIPGTPAQYGVVAGNRFTLYYQANLSVLKNPTGVVFANGLNGSPFFTFTAGAGEVVTSVTTIGSEGKVTANFEFDATNKTTNFFRIYAAAAAGNDLTGMGFSTGTLIYEGQIINEPSSSFTTNLPLGNKQLDQYGTDDFPGITSQVGSGASTFNVNTTFFNAGYFPNLNINSVITSNFDTSTVTPFMQVDPSRCFANRTTDCSVQYNIGANNGTGGPDFLLQADANQVLSSAPRPVPEPGTPAVLSLGLAVMGLFGVSRKKKQG